ncbi:MAG TPA: hypothetical protein VEB59_16865 [Gemmatimonadales bacterium]|nr:hypothetical protein [Gemmatimonadales bacterium]
MAGLVLSTVGVGMTAWTGGPIGHPELRAGNGSSHSAALAKTRPE